ncbi:cysteine protease domain-containing protein [Diaporthe amygdali]|uniref:cysteine protease domain-containing protein n=1 Tax=Phomopsis amygdali TaxID=1214568 RepID=UPI0022FEDB0B|nr:cysteine protease domain-containing protein [Diaporthe amygdali]KAJ0115622.1 cysteine protease domain-containing protein [Diaporthe amygdali]
MDSHLSFSEKGAAAPASNASMTTLTQTVSASSQQANIESLPAYVIEWSPQQRRVRFLRTTEDLKTELNPENCERLNDSLKRLFVVHGSPQQYVSLLQRALFIDPLFIKAHAQRRRYSPVHRRPGDRWACFEYPELCSYGKTGGQTDEKAAAALADLPAYPLSDKSADAVMFCRASLWLNGENDGVLFLEDPPWAGASPLMRKQTTMVALHAAATDNTGSRDDESVDEHLASLEIILQEALRDPEHMRHGIRALLSELVYTHWLTFFESPLIDPEAHPAHILSLAWRVQLAVEHNLNITRYLRRWGMEMPITAIEWEGLLDRNGRRVDLATVAAGGASAIAEEFRAIQAGNNPKRTLAPGEKDENSRGLDRISYLGGILLPFTIVPSILSMSDPFGPTGGLFWVFWVVCAPLTVITLLFIYADSIRKATVWIEVAADEAKVEEQAGQSVGVVEDDGTVEPKPLLGSKMDHPDDVMEEGVETFPTVVIQRPQDGRPPRAYKRQELGWTGAMKSMVGYGYNDRLSEPAPMEKSKQQSVYQFAFCARVSSIKRLNSIISNQRPCI